MDHNLEDSLNLESAMGMDFESAEDVVVSQTDINLDPSNQEGDMRMEFEHIEEQPMLMDSGNEEIVVSDFMGDQFNLQEYSIHDDQTTGMTTTEDSNQQNLLQHQSESIDLQFEPQDITPVRLEVKGKPKYIAVKASSSSSSPAIAPKKSDASVLPSAPRQIAIAPKLPRLVPAVAGVTGRFVPQTKPIAIAPTPVALVTNRTNVVKKVPISTVVKDGSQQSILAQIGKQLVMMPTLVGGQKIKLVTTSNTGGSAVQYIKASSDQAQLIPAKNISGVQTNKPVMAKVIYQGQGVDLANQPAVITKVLPPSQPQTRYVMQRKTVPISLTKEVVMGSPTKQGVKFMKKQQQIISLNSPTTSIRGSDPSPTTPLRGPAPPSTIPKRGPVPGTATKVMIAPAPNTTNPAQNVILKTTAPQKTAQITKDGKVIVQGQRSQLHQINVPGKGIQYIRLISNQASTTGKAAVTKAQAIGATKSFVISDNKGNLIQVSAAKVAGSQPPPLVFTSNSGPAPDKRPQQKLVRIAAAPMTVKTTPISQASVRSSQSLLAPLSSSELQPTISSIEELPIEPPAASNMEPLEPDPAQELQLETLEEYEVAETVAEAEVEETDSKAALRALIADAVGSDAHHHDQQSPEESENSHSNSMDHLVQIDRQEEHPLIVISSNYMKQEAMDENSIHQDDSNERSMHIDKDILNTYQPPSTPPTISETDVITDELGFKPRRACNCTKSQCLKLYCDCFANGEFCNSCNCNNCHNNLDNEELRQKAIRACLERNPNAFRPKIGKTKAGGPEIIRRHNKGCNCKRSGCLKNYCECYEAKIACTSMCKCVGCRNVEDGLQRRRAPPPTLYRPPPPAHHKQPCSFMTSEVIEAVVQCLIAASAETSDRNQADVDPVRDVIEEFSRCLQDVISASHHEAA